MNHPRRFATTPSDAPSRTVRCPCCGGPSVYGPDNAYRPFCSERCKLNDLGAWANERFRVETQEGDGAEQANRPPMP